MLDNLRALADRLRLHAFELTNGGANASQLRNDLRDAANYLTGQMASRVGKSGATFLFESESDATRFDVAQDAKFEKINNG